MDVGGVLSYATTGGVIALLVLTIVAIAIAIQEATRYEETSGLRSAATRFAAGVVFVWFVAGLIQQVRHFHSWIEVALSQSFFRGVAAVLVVWYAFFRDANPD